MRDNASSPKFANGPAARGASLRDTGCDTGCDTGHGAGLRRRWARLSDVLLAGVLTLYVPVAAYAQTKPASGTGNRHFSAAPVPKSDEEANSLDYIMGVHVNTLFFVAVGVFALFWFTLGGGRKAKNLGRQND